MIAIISLVLSIIGLIALGLHVILGDAAHGGIAHTGSGAQTWLQEMGFFRPNVTASGPIMVPNIRPAVETAATHFAVFPEGSIPDGTVFQ